jgi:hypothetical protein
MHNDLIVLWTLQSTCCVWDSQLHGSVIWEWVQLIRLSSARSLRFQEKARTALLQGIMRCCAVAIAKVGVAALHADKQLHRCLLR